MKKLIHRYYISKYRRISEGLIFAAISTAALALCINGIYEHTQSQINIIMTFCVAMISMVLGLAALFHKDKLESIQGCRGAELDLKAR